MNVLKGISGAVFLTFGLLGCAVSLFGIIDPSGSKLADDGDPFGTPPSIVSSLAVLIVYVAITAFGAYLLSRLKGSRHDA